MKILYSPDVREKLNSLKRQGRMDTVKRIVEEIDGLGETPYKYPSIERMLDIPSPYYALHEAHFYVFYRVENDVVYVTDMYNEKEDFMWKMFGISLRTQESIDYWGE